MTGATEALLFAAFAAGFLGSGHCVGMCGPMVILLERPQESPGGLARRLAGNAGRLTSYLLLGALAGAAGVVLTRLAGLEAALMALRAIAVAVVLLLALDLIFDVRTLGFLEAAGSRVWRRLSPLAGKLLPATTLPRAFGAGLLWGMLPCGLVYAAAALAAGSGDIASGAAVMAAFGLGTLPALLAAGALTGRLASMRRRRGVRRAFGVVVLAAGLSAALLPLQHDEGHAVHAHAEEAHLHASDGPGPGH